MIIRYTKAKNNSRYLTKYASSTRVIYRTLDPGGTMSADRKPHCIIETSGRELGIYYSIAGATAETTDGDAFASCAWNHVETPGWSQTEGPEDAETSLVLTFLKANRPQGPMGGA